MGKQTDRQFLQAHGFPASSKDSIRRAIVKWFSANEGRLTKEDKAFLKALTEHATKS